MYDAIFIVIGLFYLLIALRRLAVTMYGLVKLRQVPPQNSLRLFDMNYDSKDTIRRIGASILAAVISAVCLCVSLSRFHMQALSAMLVMFIIASAIELAMLLLYYRRGRSAYLTPYGIVTAVGLYRRGSFKFTIETETSSRLKIISVFRSTGSAPRRFEVVEKEEEAVDMVEKL